MAVLLVEVSTTELGAYSTGSTIKIYNAATGDLEKVYQIVLYGDLNGDGTINSIDSDAVLYNLMGVTDWEWNSAGTYDQYYAEAGDLNGDYAIDDSDGFIISQTEAYASVIDQQNGCEMAF